LNRVIEDLAIGKVVCPADIQVRPQSLGSRHETLPQGRLAKLDVEQAHLPSLPEQGLCIRQPGHGAAVFEGISGLVDADDAEDLIVQPDRLAGMPLQRSGRCTAKQDRRAVRGTRLGAVKAASFRHMEASKQETGFGITEHEEEGDVFGPNEALQHPAGVLHLGAGQQVFDQTFVDRAIADFERVRLTDDQIGVAAAEHRPVARIQAAGHRAECQHGCNADGDPEHGQNRPRPATDKVSNADPQHEPPGRSPAPHAAGDRVHSLTLCAL
jgi:hypothetical protein